MAESRLENLKCFEDESLLARDRAVFVLLLICRRRDETSRGNGDSVQGGGVEIGVPRYGTNNTCRRRFPFLCLSLTHTLFLLLYSIQGKQPPILPSTSGFLHSRFDGFADAIAKKEFDGSGIPDCDAVFCLLHLFLPRIGLIFNSTRLNFRSRNRNVVRCTITSSFASSIIKLTCTTWLIIF